jgi:hypothetical protein
LPVGTAARLPNRVLVLTDQLHIKCYVRNDALTVLGSLPPPPG